MKKLLPTIFFAALVAACSSGPPPPPPPPPWSPAGTYDVSIDAMGMMLGGELTISEVDGAYSGSLATEMGSVELHDFVVDPDAKQVEFMGTSPEFSLSFMVTVDEGELNGQFEVPGMGAGSISGVKREGSQP